MGIAHYEYCVCILKPVYRNYDVISPSEDELLQDLNVINCFFILTISIRQDMLWQTTIVCAPLCTLQSNFMCPSSKEIGPRRVQAAIQIAN